MHPDDVVYLDFAATSAIRPPEVIQAVADYLSGVGATPGRSGHRWAVDASRVAFRCRQRLAELFAIPGDPGRIVFQLNATHALNTALCGLLRPGDRVVRTQYDHNAVRRPVAALARQGVAETVLSGSAGGGIDLDEAERALEGSGLRAAGQHGRKPARLLVLPHASNVTGATLPVAQLAERAHACGALVLLDAAQTAGHVPLNVEQLGADLLAFTGHKGLLGPQGVGGLWVRDGIEVDPLLYGGTGGDSEPLQMPRALPDRLEAGTQNGPGIAGLLAGVEWIAHRGVATLHEREKQRKAELLRGLAGVAGVTIHSPAAPEGVGIVTLTSSGMDPARLAARLDREHGVLARAGLHCAPGAHEALGTARSGALRLSVGWATTEAHVGRAVSAIAAVCGAAELGANSSALPVGAPA